MQSLMQESILGKPAAETGRTDPPQTKRAAAALVAEPDIRAILDAVQSNPSSSAAPQPAAPQPAAPQLAAPQLAAPQPAAAQHTAALPAANQPAAARPPRAQSHRSYGVIAWENTVEGYVVPNLDALIDADNAVGVARISVTVSFDAFVRPGTSLSACTAVTAHPHGLAQCRRFAQEHHLRAVPASSNGAACRDLHADQVGLGPSICGDLYGLERVGAAVEDYPGSQTDFLLLAPRDEVARLVGGTLRDGTGECESIIAFIPLSTGPGVLANLLDVLRDAGLNMTSFISRPIKGHAGTYSFIATIDAAPWQPRLHAVLEEVVDHGDWVKTLAVYPRRERPNPPVYDWSLPRGGVRVGNRGTGDASQEGGRWPAAARQELLW